MGIMDETHALIVQAHPIALAVLAIGLIVLGRRIHVRGIKEAQLREGTVSHRMAAITRMIENATFWAIIVVGSTDGIEIEIGKGKGVFLMVAGHTVMGVEGEDNLDASFVDDYA